MTRTDADPHDLTGCGVFETIDGDVVLYDSENPDAWVQSNYAIDVGSPTAGPAN